MNGFDFDFDLFLMAWHWKPAIEDMNWKAPGRIKKKVVSGIGVGESKILIDATILEDMGK